VLNADRSISEKISFAVFLRIAIAIDPLCEMPSGDIAVGMPIIVGMPGCLCCPPKIDAIPLAIPKLWLCVYERFLPYLYKR